MTLVRTRTQRPPGGQQKAILAGETACDGVDAKTDDRINLPAYADSREDIANLKSDVAYMRQQVHGLRSKLHGELAVLALRIEDNERRAMKRRKVVRGWAMAAVVAAWLWMSPRAVLSILHGPFLLPALLLVGMTLVGGITLVVLILHNVDDEQDHSDRYQNWFRLTTRDDL